ncbi:hypothetical protein [Domibacillus enclensis]|uniref:hypothetical protein n=1 Tax=Domibacillus enclensis TaxID=1017273 RepID=UPI0011154A4B|nr:hypothetical protein [Domibacillus enclensis]
MGNRRRAFHAIKKASRLTGKLFWNAETQMRPLFMSKIKAIVFSRKELNKRNPVQIVVEVTGNRQHLTDKMLYPVRLACLSVTSFILSVKMEKRLFNLLFGSDPFHF